jgi:hypothetical protein
VTVWPVIQLFLLDVIEREEKRREREKRERERERERERDQEGLCNVEGVMLAFYAHRNQASGNSGCEPR